jgi:hypothetical protein
LRIVVFLSVVPVGVAATVFGQDIPAPAQLGRSRRERSARCPVGCGAGAVPRRLEGTVAAVGIEAGEALDPPRPAGGVRTRSLGWSPLTGAAGRPLDAADDVATVVGGVASRMSASASGVAKAETVACDDHWLVLAFDTGNDIG